MRDTPAPAPAIRISHRNLEMAHDPVVL